MLNPDFRSADEIIVPPNAQFGWTDGKETESSALLREQIGREHLEDDMPVACRVSASIEPLPEALTAWNLFQKSKGRAEGSYDWSLLDEFLIGKPLHWKAQIVGSCVVSNSYRGWNIRGMYQISLLGLPQEYLGRNEFGPNNYAFYAAYTYGMARKRANMRGGDGLYCEALQSSFLKDGVVACNTPALIELCKRLNVSKDTDFPEPQNEQVYRAFGDWKYLDELTPYADYVLEECPSVTKVDQLIERLKECKPTFICSMLAIKKVGMHKDGFAIHARNPSDQWAHNMCFHGFFITSDNQLMIRFSNESWGPEHIYNVPYEEVDDWFLRRNVTAAAIGNIRGPKSAPPQMA